MDQELKACRNCGGKCDPTGWMRGDGRQGPECEGCGITTPDVESWNRLMGDQLPSRVGEAVATHLGWDFLDDGSRVATYFIRAAGEVAPKLYTHPADQVEDDLTMVKVSRELLQDLRDLAFDQVEHHRAAMGAYKQTRQSAMDSVLAQADALLRT